MARYVVSGSDLTDVADAIREKGGTSEKLSFPDGFEDAIEALPDEAVLQEKSVDPTTEQQVVEPDEGKDGLSRVRVGAISPVKSAADLTANGDTVTVPAGWYEQQAQKAVAAGSEGTPSATKGPVSNHKVSVTPSVTNGAGYIAGGTKTGTPVEVTVAELESGTKEISENGSDIDVSGYSKVDVDVRPKLQSKSATPSTSQQIIKPDNDKDGLDKVTVEPISPVKTAADLTESGGTVTVPAGWYAAQAQKAVPAGSASMPNDPVTANPVITVGNDGLITASVNTSQGATPVVSPGYVASGTLGSIYVRGGATEQLPTQVAQTITPGTQDQTIRKEHRLFV